MPTVSQATLQYIRWLCYVLGRMYIFNDRVSSRVSACVQHFSCVEDNNEYNIVDLWLIHTIPNDNFFTDAIIIWLLY